MADTQPSSTIPAAYRPSFVSHAFEEHSVDLGEVVLNYAVTGGADQPPLLLIPGQTESWWGFEAAMGILGEKFRVYAVDLRGQGRSTWTPGRYTLDNMGNDLVRFIALVVGRPVVTSGCSSGGLLSAWLSAYGLPSTIRGSHYEDPPLFGSELNPRFGHSLRQAAAGPWLALLSKYLGDQWSIGEWHGLNAAAKVNDSFIARAMGAADSPSQNIREYDPEWGRAFVSGTVAQSCDHARMLSKVKVPVLFTHHARMINQATGDLDGAISDFQAEKVKEILAGTGQPFEYVSLPDAAHGMHHADPPRFAKVLGDWASMLPT